MGYQWELLDELVEIIVDVVTVPRENIRIGNTVYPYSLVKSQMLKLNMGHIRYVMESMEKVTDPIHNIRAYLLASLYNAPNTIHNYYNAKVNHDLYGERYINIHE